MHPITLPDKLLRHAVRVQDLIAEPLSPRLWLCEGIPEVTEKATTALRPAAHARQLLDGCDGLLDSSSRRATNHLSGIGATIRDLVKNVAFEQY